MTKEEFIKNLGENESVYIMRLAEEFFSQNVVIPKGANRHPYADVLHEWIEGATIQIFDDHPYSKCFMPLKGMVVNSDTPKDLLDKLFTNELRIKPSEPVYEWQWFVIINKQACIVGDGRFHTDEELVKFPEYTKIEETKRERR